MARIAQQALNTALSQLFGTGATTRAESYLSVYLVACRMARRDLPTTIASANEVTDEIFTVVDHPKGRLAPLRNFDSDNSWKVRADSGRKTVWNAGTRTPAKELFQQRDGERHFSHGLRSEAAGIVAAQFEPRPPGEALAVFLLRNEEFASEPTHDQLLDAAADFLGISREEYDTIVDTDTPLGVPLIGGPGMTEADTNMAAEDRVEEY